MRENNEARLRLTLQRKRKGTVRTALSHSCHEKLAERNCASSGVISHRLLSLQRSEHPQTGWVGVEGQRGRGPEDNLSPELKTTAEMG